MLAPKLLKLNRHQNKGDLISFISYFWLRVRNLQAYENHARIPMFVTPSLLYENV